MIESNPVWTDAPGALGSYRKWQAPTQGAYMNEGHRSLERRPAREPAGISQSDQAGCRPSINSAGLIELTRCKRLKGPLAVRPERRPGVHVCWLEAEKGEPDGIRIGVGILIGIGIGRCSNVGHVWWRRWSPRRAQDGAQAKLLIQFRCRLSRASRSSFIIPSRWLARPTQTDRLGRAGDGWAGEKVES